MGLRGRYLAAFLLAAALSAALPACGGDDDDGGSERPPMARPEDFPKPAGKTIDELRASLPQGPVFAPSGAVFKADSRNRFGFGLFDLERKQIADAPVVLYLARSGGEAQGPYPARYESLEVDPQFQSETVSSDPDSAKSVYVADIEFGPEGQYDVLAVAKLDDRLVAAQNATPEPLAAMRNLPVPDVGEEAPRISTPTVDSVGGDVEQIDTRTPPGSMHDVDFADVVGRKPVMLLFSTPQLCQARVCGPVVDILEQVKSQNEGDAAFIHMEVYKDNEIRPGCLEGQRPVEQCLRPQLIDFGLFTEPWLFAIDAEGKVAARLEGAFSAREAEQALEAATAGG